MHRVDATPDHERVSRMSTTLRPFWLWLPVLCGGVSALSGCRTKAPVVQHFLRVPAECTGGLSSIQRERLFKDSRRMLPRKKELAATGYLALPGTVTGRGDTLDGVEVLHVTGSGAVTGVAVLVIHAGQSARSQSLRLLVAERFIYRDVSAVVPGGPLIWRMNPASDSITGYRRSEGQGAALPVARFSWNGATWVSGH